MKRKGKRFAAGEVRFRASKADLDRIHWLLEHYPDRIVTHTISSLIRVLIFREYERLQPKTGT